MKRPRRKHENHQDSSYPSHESAVARKRERRMGPVGYYLYRDAKSYQAGKPSLHTKFGPYASMKEAEAKREEKEAGGRPGYVYHYRIAVEPIIIPE
jgi:hypothetical protein